MINKSINIFSSPAFHFPMNIFVSRDIACFSESHVTIEKSSWLFRGAKKITWFFVSTYNVLTDTQWTFSPILANLLFSAFPKARGKRISIRRPRAGNSRKPQMDSRRGISTDSLITSQNDSAVKARAPGQPIKTSRITPLRLPHKPPGFFCRVSMRADVGGTSKRVERRQRTENECRGGRPPTTSRSARAPPPRVSTQWWPRPTIDASSPCYVIGRVRLSRGNFCLLDHRRPFSLLARLLEKCELFRRRSFNGPRTCQKARVARFLSWRQFRGRLWFCIVGWCDGSVFKRVGKFVGPRLIGSEYCGCVDDVSVNFTRREWMMNWAVADLWMALIGLVCPVIYVSP